MNLWQESIGKHQQLLGVGDDGHEVHIAIDGGFVSARTPHQAAAQQTLQDSDTQLQSLSLWEVGIAGFHLDYMSDSPIAN